MATGLQYSASGNHSLQDKVCLQKTIVQGKGCWAAALPCVVACNGGLDAEMQCCICDNTP